MREDFIVSTLGDIFKIVSGSTPKGLKEVSDVGEIPFYKVSDMNHKGNEVFMRKSNIYLTVADFKNLKLKYYPKGTVIFPKRGGAILTNKKRVLFQTSCFDLNLMGVLPNKFINNNYLFFWFQKLDLCNIYDGSNVPQINNKNILPLNFPITSLVEQKAIVKKLEELFSSLESGITDLKKAQDQLVIYRQAVLKKAFEGDLTKEWREKQTNLPSADELLELIKEERQKHYEQQLADWKEVVKIWERNGKDGKKPKKPTILKSELDLSKLVQQLTDLPNEWTYINLDYAVYKLGDGLHGTPKYSETGDYYFINGNNLDNGKINIKPNTKRVDYSEYLKYKKDLNKDTVFVSINGTIGNVSFYNNEKVILGKSACYFNLLSGFEKNYIKWRIDSLGFRNYAFKNATGSTIKNVPLSAMRNYTFPLCSKEEQHQIILEIESRLSVCDKVEESIIESLHKAQALRQSILKKAFEGKLLSEEEIAKCKADKDYEPASVLLDKIKAEKKQK